jgi:UDP-N-acetylmuramoyl-L-alanyl-D-glutamate--2,6-diaminopimelate ligase
VTAGVADSAYSRRAASPVDLAVLCDLLGVPVIPGVVTGVTLASQMVQPGDLYAALPGARTHGARFGRDAVSRGAAAVLTDAEGAAIIGEVEVPVLVTDDPRGMLGAVSATVYGFPAQTLRTFGVTGTNGKTTVTYMLTAALHALGVTTGMIGTTGTWIGETRVPTVRTTPEAPDVQALMALMRDEGVQALSMEVSSHALVLGRVDGFSFDVAAFTNLSPDHLDFHETMQAYFEAKARLFTQAHAHCGVINTDDEWGQRLARETELPVTTYALHGPADLTAVDIHCRAEGSRFDVVAGGHRHSVRLAAPGLFNVANALGAIGMLQAGGVALPEAAEALGSFHGVPGRMEVVPGEVAVIVDYAHTPDAVHRALDAVRPLTQGRIVCVLGCGGDRDSQKRPHMGRIAAQDSDVLIVTDDNPRSEVPADIRAAVLQGARGVPGATVAEVGDRAAAIEQAILDARPGDTVMILGKGHETGQEIQGEIHPFDDRLVAREALERRA